MKPIINFTTYISILLLSFLISFPCKADSLWNSFINPSNEARTKLWWFHGETETTREGIDADLQAFKDAGIGGVVFYDQTHGNQEGACPALSQDWWEMLKYAALKAKEVGLTFDIASTNGYVAGGPWITPENGMQKIVTLRPGEEAPAGFRPLTSISTPLPVESTFIDTLILKERVTLLDNKPLQITADFGTTKEIRTISYIARPRGKGAYGSMNIPGKPQKDYFGAMYILFPPIGELECSDDGINWTTVTSLRGIEDVIGHKSRQRTVNFPPVTARFFRLNIHDWQGSSEKHNNLYLENIRLMSYDMTDNWENKSGLRSELPSECAIDRNSDFKPFAGDVIIGYAPTGGHAKHGRSRIVWNGDTLHAKTWPEADVLSAKAAEIHYNSYFKAIHDTLTSIGCKPGGMQIDSHEAGIANWTEKMPDHFKRLRGYDIERWIPALGGYIVDSREATEKFLRDFKLTLSELVREQFYGTIESLCRRDGVTLTSQAMLGCTNDNIASRGCVAKPQGEFWGYQKNGNYDCLDAASAAHLYGKKIASGEAFTDSPYFFPENENDSIWKERGWHELLQIANLAYCKGINEFVVCASSYQPWLDRKYDDSASAHPYIFHRHNSAWDKSREHFWEYQARCSQMLQAGRPVVDILVYIGSDLPAKTMAFKLPEIPEGYNFDVCTPASLKQWIENPTELSPEYRILAVQDRSDISEEAEKMFEILKKRGMPIVRCDKGETLADALAKTGFSPDLHIKSDDLPESKVYFTHRQTEDEDIYFVYNHSQKPFSSPLRLRSDRKHLEVWNPLTAERIIKHDSILSLRPYESIFIVAR
ncbi:MAG: hypothetical protein K2K75_11315 [Muribaculaceae bacterium]|nr:hypothetical protein [Muribaculaceae bacterium]